jgi:glycerate dehydrogenase
MEGVEFVSLPTLFERCNVVSLHAPLNADNEAIINGTLLRSMPRPSYLINTGRGGLINETELADCLQNNHLDGAALDVLQQEPPPSDHPLLGIPNCIITPHVAWATLAARQRLLAETVLNIKAFLSGEERNLVSECVG